MKRPIWKSWLPRMDSNHDKVIQNHLCYRYTTRQLEKGNNALGAGDVQSQSPRPPVGSRLFKPLLAAEVPLSARQI